MHKFLTSISGASQIIFESTHDIFDHHVIFLMRGDEIGDHSKYGIPIINKGVVVSHDQSKSGHGSLYFNGSAQIHFSDPRLIFGASDFTIDWWEFRLTSGGTTAVLNYSLDFGYCNLLMSHKGGGVYGSYDTTTGWTLISVADVFSNSPGRWIHKAIVRSETDFYIFEDGKIKLHYTGMIKSLSGGSGDCLIGSHFNPLDLDYFAGYIENFRISNVARWTSAFTPAD